MKFLFRRASLIPVVCFLLLLTGKLADLTLFEIYGSAARKGRNVQWNDEFANVQSNEYLELTTALCEDLSKALVESIGSFEGLEVRCLGATYSAFGSITQFEVVLLYESADMRFTLLDSNVVVGKLFIEMAELSKSDDAVLMRRGLECKVISIYGLSKPKTDDPDPEESTLCELKGWVLENGTVVKWNETLKKHDSDAYQGLSTALCKDLSAALTNKGGAFEDVHMWCYQTLFVNLRAEETTSRIYVYFKTLDLEKKSINPNTDDLITKLISAIANMNTSVGVLLDELMTAKVISVNGSYVNSVGEDEQLRVTTLCQLGGKVSRNGVNVNWTEKLADENSTEHASLANDLCQYISTELRNDRKYFSGVRLKCMDTVFTDCKNVTYGKFYIRFGTNQLSRNNISIHNDDLVTKVTEVITIRDNSTVVALKEPIEGRVVMIDGVDQKYDEEGEEFNCDKSQEINEDNTTTEEEINEDNTTTEEEINEDNTTTEGPVEEDEMITEDNSSGIPIQITTWMVTIATVVCFFNIA